MVPKFLTQKMELSIKNLNSSIYNSKEVKSIMLDNSFFDSRYFENDIRKLELKKVFDNLQDIKLPVLYWFEIDTNFINAKKIRTLYLDYLEQKTNRKVSSYKKSFDENSKTLYVGKVKTGFWGRLITHLGYHKSCQTAGLQLYHWCNSANGLPALKLNYIVFEREMEDLISILELELARELKPILGKY